MTWLEYITSIGTYPTLIYPSDVYTDNTRVYVASQGSYYAAVWDKTTYAFIGGVNTDPPGPSQNSFVVGIAVDDNYIYMTDNNHHRVLVYNKITFAFVSKFGSYGTDNNQFYYPNGIDIDDNYIYVNDTENQKIKKFNKSSFAFAGSFNIEAKTSRISIKNELLYLACYASSTVKIYNKTSGALLSTIGGYGTADGLFQLTQKAIEQGKNIYITDVANYRVQVFSKSKEKFKRKFGSYGGGSGQFNFPAGIAADETKLFVTDYQNHTVQIFNNIETKIHLAGRHAWKNKIGKFYGPCGARDFADFTSGLNQVNNNDKMTVVIRTVNLLTGNYTDEIVTTTIKEA